MHGASARTGEGVTVATRAKRPVPTRSELAERLLRRDLYWYGLSRFGLTHLQIAESSGFGRVTVTEAIDRVRSKFGCRDSALKEMLRALLAELEGEPDA